MAARSQADALDVICGICHNDALRAVGELDCCFHRFCFPCILQWSQIESRCPFCKQRFAHLVHKRLSAAARKATDPGQLYLDGKVVETLEIPERDQQSATAEQDPMAGVVCMHCHGGGDDNLLLLCDGCDHAMHTYCAELHAVPEGEWFCPTCVADGTAESAATAVDLVWSSDEAASDSASEGAHPAAAAGRRGSRRSSRLSGQPPEAPAGAAAGRPVGRRGRLRAAREAGGSEQAAQTARSSELDDLDDADANFDEEQDVLQDVALSQRLSSVGRQRRRLMRGSERTVGGARGHVEVLRRRVQEAEAASEQLPSHAHRRVQAMRESFAARREADRLEEETAARQAAAAAADGFGGGADGARAGMSVSAAARAELREAAEAGARQASLAGSSPKFKRPSANGGRRHAPCVLPASRPVKRQLPSSPPRSPRMGSPRRRLSSPKLESARPPGSSVDHSRVRETAGARDRASWDGGERAPQQHSGSIAASGGQDAAADPTPRPSAPVPPRAKHEVGRQQQWLVKQEVGHQQQQAKQVAEHHLQQQEAGSRRRSRWGELPAAPPPAAEPASAIDPTAAEAIARATSKANAFAFAHSKPTPKLPTAVPSEPAATLDMAWPNQPPLPLPGSLPPPVPPTTNKPPVGPQRWQQHAAAQPATPAFQQQQLQAAGVPPPQLPPQPLQQRASEPAAPAPPTPPSQAPPPPPPLLPSPTGRASRIDGSRSMPAPPPAPEAEAYSPTHEDISESASAAVPRPSAVATFATAAATSSTAAKPETDAATAASSSNKAAGAAGSVSGAAQSAALSGAAAGSSGGDGTSAVLTTDAASEDAAINWLGSGLTAEQLRHKRKRLMKDTAPAVRDMLKPLYAAKTIDKERFKLVAQAATTDLVESVDPATMTADDVHAAIQRALEPMGLSLPD